MRAIIIIIIIIFLLGCSSNAQDTILIKERQDTQIETSCPIGNINDLAPGSCGLYEDKNKNNICDLSE